MISIEQIESITQIDASEWDQLAGRRVLASYGWLRTMLDTQCSPNSPRYFLARTAAGLVGAVVCELHDSSSTSDMRALLFGRLGKPAACLSLSPLPSLVCGARIGMLEPILVRGDITGEDRERVTLKLVQAVEETARGNGWTVCFRGVSPRRSPGIDHSLIVEVLANRGYLRSPELPAASLELCPGWRCFADFRRHLKKTHPRTATNLNVEINRAKRNGLVIEQLDNPEPHSDRLHHLMDSHYRRLNRQPFMFRPEFFDRLKARLGERAVIYVARIGTTIIGASIALRDDDEVFFPMIGVDHDSSRLAAVYFNLGYNRPIEDSIAAGHRRIYFGKSAYDTKARRGCIRVETDFYLRVWSRLHERALRAFFILRSRRIDSKTTALLHRKEDR